MKNKRNGTNSAIKDKVTLAQTCKLYGIVMKSLLQRYPFQTVFILTLSLIGMVINVIELKFTEYTVNSIAFYLNRNDSQTFKTIVLRFCFYFGVLIIANLISCFSNYITVKYQKAVSMDVEKIIIDKLSNISYEYNETHSFYEKINLARQVSSQYSQAVYGIKQIINIVFMLVFYTVLLSKLHGIYILISLLAVIISIVVSMRITDRQLDFWRQYVSPESRKNAYFKGIFGHRINHQNIQTTKSYAFFSAKYKTYNNCEQKNYIRLNFLSFISDFATSFLFLITFFYTAWVLGKGVAVGSYQIGYYSMVIALLIKLFSTMKRFTAFFMNENWYIKVITAFYEILELKETETSSPQNDLNQFRGIICENLSYCYPQSNRNVLNQINISFKHPESIAIVGCNGSGKTTLVSIILNLLASYEGHFINYSICSAVLQDFVHYQMTIKENIEIGCGGKSLSEKRILKILKKVGLYEYVNTLPKGINTELGQLNQGIELSKGQWQRLAIGRLLANEESNVWILDEPTAYLDPITEIQIYDLILSLAGERLIFFISHRLGFAKKANRILLVHNGQIVQNGTHKELMADRCDIYRKMYESQKAWYEK